MTLIEKLEADMKQAMRDRDETARDTLRMVLADLKNRSIESGQELDDAQAQAAVERAAKTRRESVGQYEAGGREDLAAQERAEIVVLERYLPTQLDEAATTEVVKTLIAELGLASKKDMGKLMKEVMARHRGQIDGKAVQRIAQDLLA